MLRKELSNARKMLQEGLIAGMKDVKTEVKNEEKEEWVWVEGYKGTDSDMKCRDQQYEIGKTYVMPEDSKIEACESGFHLCLGLIDVFGYYSIGKGRRFFKVKALVRKSDLDNQAKPTSYLRSSNHMIFKNFSMPSFTYDPSTGMPKISKGPDDKLAAKSIEFIRELTIDEIFENTYGKDWSEDDKKLALVEGMSMVEELIKERELKIKQQEQEDTLVSLGYSRPFAAWIVQDGKYDKAYAVGTQNDLSMDLKVLAIMKM